jgi:phosphatidylglycerophosphate synthase
MSRLGHDLLRPPHLLSLARIVLVCATGGALLAGRPLVALALGVPAGVSDYLDGWLARRRGEATALGAILDSLADSVFLLVLLAVAQELEVWPFYLLLVWGLRDLGVLALRASAAGQGFAIPSSLTGKIGFNLSGWSFLFMTLDLAWPHPALRWIGLGAIHAGLALAWVAAAGYLRAYVRGYRGGPVV